jgi:hypothetical protein
MIRLGELADYVVAVLVGEHHLDTSPTLRSIERWQIETRISTDIVRNVGSRLDYFSFIGLLKQRHRNKNLIVMHADIFFGEDFFERLLEQITIIEQARVKWGVLGAAGVTFPYFKIVRNVVDVHGILYPFWRPLPAVHLDGHLLVIHRTLDIAFEPNFRGFHHYDTLLCIQSWRQGLPAFVINLPLRHLGQGNAQEWRERSAHLGRILSKTYGNKALITSMGPVQLTSAYGTTRDFYKHEVIPALESSFAHKRPPDATIIVKIHNEDHGSVREALLAVCAQFTKPDRVVVLCRQKFREDLDRLAAPFRVIVDIVFVICPDDADPSDICFGCGNKIKALLPAGGIVSVIDSRAVIFPNYVRDFKNFYVYSFGGAETVAALDMNYAVKDHAGATTCDSAPARLVHGQITETIEDVVPDNFIALSSFGLPALIFNAVLDSHVHGSLLHDVFVLKVLEHARVFFLRRLGGFIKTSVPELKSAEKDEFEEIAVLGEFFRSRYPYAFLFMNKRHGGVPAVSAPPPELSREAMIGVKLAQYPKVVAGIFWTHSFVSKIRRIYRKVGSH